MTKTDSARASSSLGRACASAALALALLGSALPLAAPASPLAAQEIGDSLRNAVLERLERLNRRMGDSTGLRADTSDTVATPDAPDSDSTLQALLDLPGYGVTEYWGRAAEFETASRVLTLSGAEGERARMTRDGLQLSADSALVFDESAGRLVTLGSQAIYRPREGGDDVETRRIVYDLDEGRGTALDARTKMSGGMGNWSVAGDFPSVDPVRSYGHDVMFTSCDHEEPHYHFVARELKLQPGGTLVARNVLVYFGDVGVFWLPFIAQSTEQGRRSGLLPIRFSVNDVVRTSASYSRRISNLGYYWAMSDYSDAQLGLDWWSGNYVGMTGSARYEWARQFLNGSVSYRHFWRGEQGSELAFDTQHAWEPSERTKITANAKYASSASFVRRNSFDPRELTQSIDSNAGFSRRFGVADQLTLSASRRHFLSDDRVEMTLPSARFTLNRRTLFSAPEDDARFYNNMTFGASASASRNVWDRPAQDVPADSFNLSMADREKWSGRFGADLSLGNLDIGQSVELTRDVQRDLPLGFLNPASSTLRAGVGSVADLRRPRFAATRPPVAATDFTGEELTWSTTVGYQVQLVGSTSVTPRLNLSSRAIRSDTLSVGEGGFVSAPRRLSFGAGVKSDVYGFWNGDRLRHKITPTISYDYTPRTEPTAVQSATFGERAIQPKNEIRFGLSQTFEAKADEDETADSAQARSEADASGDPRPPSRANKTMVLSLQTSAVTYDFEQAREGEHFTRGFRDNLRISHQVGSDYLRGLSVSLEHGVFDDAGLSSAAVGSRDFDFFLSNVNMSFSLDQRSALFRWLRGLAGDDRPDAPDAPASTDDADPLDVEADDLGEATVVPTAGARRSAGGPRPSADRVGQWNARFSYSLVRTRADGGGSQMIQSDVSFQPTEKWSVQWSTSYDAVAGAFNDHVVRLKRDLHRWEADFSFRQTAAGNWSFMFEVALTDNRDLHFDYEQRAGGDRY